MTPARAVPRPASRLSVAGGPALVQLTLALWTYRRFPVAGLAPPPVTVPHRVGGVTSPVVTSSSEAADECLADRLDELLDVGAVSGERLDHQPVHSQIGVASRCLEIDRSGWCDGDLELAEVGWTIASRGDLAEPGQRFRRLL